MSMPKLSNESVKHDDDDEASTSDRVQTPL